MGRKSVGKTASALDYSVHAEQHHIVRAYGVSLCWSQMAAIQTMREKVLALFIGGWMLGQGS